MNRTLGAEEVMSLRARTGEQGKTPSQPKLTVFQDETMCSAVGVGHHFRVICYPSLREKFWRNLKMMAAGSSEMPDPTTQ